MLSARRKARAPAAGSDRIRRRRAGSTDWQSPDRFPCRSALSRTSMTTSAGCPDLSSSFKLAQILCFAGPGRPEPFGGSSRGTRRARATPPIKLSRESQHPSTAWELCRARRPGSGRAWAGQAGPAEVASGPGLLRPFRQQGCNSPSVYIAEPGAR